MVDRRPLIYFSTLFAVAGLATLLTLPTNLDPGSTAVAALPAALPQLEGTWSGSWTDTVYSVTGALEIVVWSTGSDYAATGTIDVGEISPGLGVLAGGATGTGDGTTLDITFDCLNLGSGTVQLVSNGGGATATGAGTVTAPLSFGAFTITGTATDSDLSGSFDFTSPGGGKGIAQLNKTSVPVQSTSWGDVKATYSGR